MCTKSKAMNLFQTLSAPFVSRDRRMARFRKLEIDDACLCDDEGDQFFAQVTYYYRENDTEYAITEVTVSYAAIVGVSDRILLEGVVDAARGKFEDPNKKRHFDLNFVERIIEDHD